MSYTEDEAREKGEALTDALADERAKVEVSEDEWYEGEYTLHLLTPSYDLPANVMTALHRCGPYGVRHLGQVRDNDSRDVWLLKEKDE